MQKQQKQSRYWKGLKNSLFCLFSLCVMSAASYAGQENKMLAPRIKGAAVKKLPKAVEYETSVPKLVFGGYVVFFQRYISPADGPRCQFYPTCSQYGRQAIQEHGAFLGFVMSAERLMRDNGGVPQYYPLIRRGKQFYYHDPLTNNDFWLD